MPLETVPTTLADARVISVPVFPDNRGTFQEAFARSKYRAIGITEEFVQDNVSRSRRGVLRGMHTDPRMSKLAYVMRGEVYDVIVDARKGSNTFGKWEGFALREGDGKQLYIPVGFLHGFLALTDEVIFCYKQSAEYAPEHEIGIRWDDPDLGIAWPLEAAPIVSARDAANGSFRERFLTNA